MNTTLVYDPTETYVQMHFNGGENCTATQNYTLSISLKCNAYGSVFDALWIGNVDDTDKCNPMIPVSHKSACPVFSISTFANFFLSKPYIIGPIAIVIGLLVAFTGRKFFPLTIGVIGIGLGGGITLILCSMINLLTSIQLDNTDQEYTDPIYMAILTWTVSVIVGLFVGFILTKMLHIGAAIIGAIGGFFIGIAVYNLIFFFAKSAFVLTSCSVIGSIIMAILSFKFYDDIVIFGTSFVGSYSFVRGISFFLGNFPNEYQFF